MAQGFMAPSALLVWLGVYIGRIVDRLRLRRNRKESVTLFDFVYT